MRAISKISSLRLRRTAVALTLLVTFAGALVFASDRQSPFPPGKRGFCFKNSCPFNVRPGQIGAASGIYCTEGCPKGTVCNPWNNLCHFNLDLSKVGILQPNSDRKCVEFDQTVVETKVYPSTGMQKINMSWNGALYGSTACRADGTCDTALCKECTTFVGPTGPHTFAELTLMLDVRDSYAVKLTAGANVPLTVKPLSPSGSFTIPRYGVTAFMCGEPGTVTPSRGEVASSWAFRPPTAIGGSPRYAMVNETARGCSSDAACNAGEQCGTAMKVGETGYPTNEVIPQICGKLTGVWSDNAICMWTDAIAHGLCKTPIPNSELGGTYQQAFGCWGPFMKACHAFDTFAGCCGCTTWPSLGLPHEEENPCKAESKGWLENVEPRIRFLKQACPTCYAWPFDEPTSLFGCRTEEADGPNMASYELEWCPNGVTLSMHTEGEEPATTQGPAATERPPATKLPTQPPQGTTWAPESSGASISIAAALFVAVFVMAVNA